MFHHTHVRSEGKKVGQCKVILAFQWGWIYVTTVRWGYVLWMPLRAEVFLCPNPPSLLYHLPCASTNANVAVLQAEEEMWACCRNETWEKRRIFSWMGFGCVVVSWTWINFNARKYRWLQAWGTDKGEAEPSWSAHPTPVVCCCIPRHNICTADPSLSAARLLASFSGRGILWGGR